MNRSYFKRHPSETVYVSDYHATHHKRCVMEFLTGHLHRTCPVCYPIFVLASEGETDSLLEAS